MNSSSFEAFDLFTSFFSEMILLNHLDFSWNELYLLQNLSSNRGASHRLLDLEETLKMSIRSTGVNMTVFSTLSLSKS